MENKTNSTAFSPAKATAVIFGILAGLGGISTRQEPRRHPASSLDYHAAGGRGFWAPDQQHTGKRGGNPDRSTWIWSWTAKAGSALQPDFAFWDVNQGYYRAVWNSSFNATTIVAPATKAITNGRTYVKAVPIKILDEIPPLGRTFRPLFLGSSQGFFFGKPPIG
jgi:hypothetical protein